MATLVTGRGTSGSWQIRGVQLGKAMGADVIAQATHVHAYDKTILVKRGTPELIRRLRGHKVIWDVVDAWPQPLGNAWPRKECIRWLTEMIGTLQPAGIIAATHAMMDDVKSIYSGEVIWLPHHHRPGLQKATPRPMVLTVGYEGGVKYLGRWLPILQRQCTAMGWNLVMNPSRYTDLDIVLAMRDTSGYAPRAWKSNVKLANAQAAGIPIICNREAGYLETAGHGVQWADTEEELIDAMQTLSSYEARCKSIGNAMTVDQCADALNLWLSRF